MASDKVRKVGSSVYYKEYPAPLMIFFNLWDTFQTGVCIRITLLWLTCRFQGPTSRNADLVDLRAQIDLDGSWTAVWELHLQAVFQAGTIPITLAQVRRRNWGWETAGASETRRKVRELSQHLKWEMTFTTQFSCNSCFCGSSGSLGGGCPQSGELTLLELCSLQRPAWRHHPILILLSKWRIGPAQLRKLLEACVFYFIGFSSSSSFLFSYLGFGDNTFQVTVPRCPCPLPGSAGPVLDCSMLLSFSVSLCLTLSLKVFLPVFSPGEAGQLVFPEHSYVDCMLLGNMWRCNRVGRTSKSEGWNLVTACSLMCQVHSWHISVQRTIEEVTIWIN